MKQPIRNIAILAHVDAGKTTLSERILFAAGEIHRPGRVEDGLATMDYMPEEKERGITIESGVAHFEWKNTWFNFIDTPGHVDFGAEVDMALTAVEGAVLVVSAASGVETQTLASFRKLRESRVRTILFVNKLDNPDYSLDETLINIEETLGVRPVLMSVPQFKNGKMCAMLDVLSQSRLVHSESGAEVLDDGWESDAGAAEERALLKKYYDEAVEFASNFDDEILSLALENKPVPPKMLLRGLKALAASDEYVICYAGSALEGFGIRSLVTALSFFLPEVPTFVKNELGQVVRLRHFRGVGEISLFRSHVDLLRRDWPAGFEFSRLKANMLLPVDEIRSGDIYAMVSPFETELGQVIWLDGRRETRDESAAGNAAPSISENYLPLLQTRVECVRTEDYAHVERSLSVLARMDPSFRVQKDDGGFWYLHTVGEVQLDVLLARLKREFGCEVRAGSPEVRWQERLCREVGPAENTFQIGPHKMAISISASPLEGDAHDIRLSAEFMEKAPLEILAGVRSALLESTEVGVLGKGPLVGVRFEVHRFEWTEGALPPMIKKCCADAVAKLVKPADVQLYEPVMELSLECPVNFAGLVTGDIQARDGKVKEIEGDGKTHFLKADVPLRKIFGYATGVRSISKGTALYSMKLLGYRPATV
ncbi:putative translation elongation factor G [Fibrobacter succinogenes subsp. succinogenes S85]|uniref:Putative translation elongation factor G n=1 Tax=Fibrobacter succinogenes (strain ATCC 19169 / S85) TaxID=59374 RepID=C9RQG7_FIBSS|nr:GTP-binding protein [Fibrobacter succinogenes]ACX74803.1 small GTP-binding protein [Fibrobacter succinogenes subsp. succinogenes S85]ADL26355.1 putative translation elongation factor G [Fibrobacter succinogenes subsp. succinogenes S85]